MRKTAVILAIVFFALNNLKLPIHAESNLKIVKTSGDLFDLAKEVNGGNSFSGQIFFLVNDIDLEGVNWTPIGKKTWSSAEPPNLPYVEKAYPFQGTLNGNGHSISGLKVESLAVYDVGGYWGLFGYVGEEGVVKNLRVEGAVSAKSRHVAGIAGENSGLIKNCLFSGDVKSETRSGFYIGGIVGRNLGTIDNCNSQGNLFSQTAPAGGVAGISRGNGIILRSTSSSTISSITEGYGIGGIVGTIDGDSVMSDCFFYGKIEGNRSSTGRIAGTLGDNAKVANCVFFKEQENDLAIGSSHSTVPPNYYEIDDIKLSPVITVLLDSYSLNIDEKKSISIKSTVFPDANANILSCLEWEVTNNKVASTLDKTLNATFKGESPGVTTAILKLKEPSKDVVSLVSVDITVKSSPSSSDGGGCSVGTATSSALLLLPLLLLGKIK